MDSIERVIPVGLEDSPCPIAAVFIDSTINSFWQHPFAHIFDLVLTDQKPDAEALQQKGLNAHWFPLAADTEIYKPIDQFKKYDISFVGNRNPSARAKRENILNLLGNHFNLKIFSGDPFLSPAETAAVYNQSKLVLNENLFPSVNLRLFEAMACGTVVLTEENDVGLTNLFTDQKHILTYNSENIIEKTDKYLNSKSTLDRIASRSSQLIIEKHSLKVRAEQLLQLFEATYKSGRQHISKGRKKSFLGQALLFYSLKWQRRDKTALVRAKLSLEESLKLEPSAEALLTLGLIYTLISENLAAQMCFQGVTNVDEKNYIGHLYLAITLQKMGRTDEANDACQRAVELVGMNCGDESVLIPFSEVFHLCWGNHFRNFDEPFSAGLMRFGLPVQFWTGLEHLKEAAELNPWHWEEVGDMLMENQAPDRALEAYQQPGSGVDAEKIIETRRKAYLQ
jgi:tetratricopeptide (TPR) repeat protein